MNSQKTVKWAQTLGTQNQNHSSVFPQSYFPTFSLKIFQISSQKHYFTDRLELGIVLVWAKVILKSFFHWLRIWYLPTGKGISPRGGLSLFKWKLQYNLNLTWCWWLCLTKSVILPQILCFFCCPKGTCSFHGIEIWLVLSAVSLASTVAHPLVANISLNVSSDHGCRSN